MCPTPYAAVNVVLRDFLVRIQGILGQNLRGMYLHGSLAIGGFAPDRSDIDFVVVMGSEVTREQFAALQNMHAAFNSGDSPWATEVEAAYIPLAAFRRHDPANAFHPHIVRGDETLIMEHLDSDWIVQRHVLRERGVIVAGPAPHTLIDPIDPQCLRWAVADIGISWLEPGFLGVDDPPALRQRGYQAYMVLTLCRMLYILEFGAIVSKPAAARWAQGTLDERWTGLIAHALSWRKDHQDTSRGDELDTTMAFIEYTVERCREVGVDVA